MTITLPGCLTKSCQVSFRAQHKLKFLHLQASANFDIKKYQRPSIQSWKYIFIHLFWVQLVFSFFHVLQCINKKKTKQLFLGLSISLLVRDCYHNSLRYFCFQEWTPFSLRWRIIPHVKIMIKLIVLIVYTQNFFNFTMCLWENGRGSKRVKNCTL